MFLLASLAVTAVVAQQVSRDNFDPFSDKADLKANLLRLQELTTGTPITTFCVDANKKALAGAALATCKNDLATELLALQLKLQQAFFDAFVRQFNTLGQPFNAAAIRNFDNLRECQTEVDVFQNLNVGNTANCRNLCNNVAAAADCLRELVRDFLRAEQATANSAKVTDAIAALDRAHLPVFDKSLNNAQRNEFLDLAKDQDRFAQSLNGVFLAQLAQTVLEFNKANYRNYKGEVQAIKNLDDEVEVLLNLAKALLAKDKQITDAVARLNAFDAKSPFGALAKGTFDLAGKRKNVIKAPVAILARVTNVDPAKLNDVINAFKASLGPETHFAAPIVDVKDATKKQFDLGMGINEDEIQNHDSEFGLTCVQQAVKCEFIEDVHKPTFDVAQVQKKLVAPPADYPVEGTHAIDHDAASSLFIAAGALLASLVLMF